MVIPEVIARNWRKLRWEFIRRGPEREITESTRNGLLTFSSRDGILASRLYVRREWSTELVDGCLELLRREGLGAEGGTLVNVGANIGSILTALMARGRFAAGLAFEPSPKNFAFLEKNVRQNGLDGAVKSFAMALSDTDGEAELELSATNFGDHRIRVDVDHGREDDYGESTRQTMSVPVRTLDSVLDDEGVELGPGSLMWVDIQGHEGQFFAGARKALASGVPVVSEFWPYGIDRAGLGRDRYCAVVEDVFTGFHARDGGEWKHHPIEEIRSWYDRYPQPRVHTDLIFVSGGGRGSGD